MDGERIWMSQEGTWLQGMGRQGATGGEVRRRMIALDLEDKALPSA